MTAAITLLGTATFNTSSGTKTVTATPAAGDQIIIITAHSGNTAATAPTDNNSGGAGTYTLLETAVKATSADTMKAWARDALIVSGTSTVFTHAPGASTGGGLAVLKVTGVEKLGSALEVQSAKQDNQAAATPAPVFGAAPKTTNAVIGAVFNGTNVAGLTPRTNFTELTDVGYNTPASGLEVMSRNSGETATTQTWGGASASAFCSLVVEVNAALTHTNTGTLTGPGSTIAGTAAHVAKHATSGALTGQGSSISGTAAHKSNHPTSGALTGSGSSIAGTAARTRVHATSGALTGAGSAIAGTAARTRVHATSGALTGQLGSIVGSADRVSGSIVSHATSGALVGSGSSITGTAARERIHTSSGALTGQLSSISGAAARTRVHATSGALTGSGSSVSGVAARTRAHATSGILAGAGAVIAGSAARVGAIITHSTSGNIIGAGSVINGVAARKVVHDCNGDIEGGGAALSNRLMMELHSGRPLRTLSNRVAVLL
jgi:hypothetical protein